MHISIGTRGATGWMFQVGRIYGQINFPRYWFLRGHMMNGAHRASFGHVGIEEKEIEGDEAWEACQLISLLHTWVIVWIS